MVKGASKFNIFLATEFLADKKLMAFKSDLLTDSEGKDVGRKYTVVVMEDNTKYNNPSISNVGDSYTVKVKGKVHEDLIFPCEVELIEPSGVLYGEFRNQLSLSAKKIIERKK